MHTRTVTCDGDANGTCAEGPCLYAGSEPTGASIADAFRSLSSGFQSKDSWAIVNGIISVSGANPNEDVVLHFHRSP
jgi:hypothetical protein